MIANIENTKDSTKALLDPINEFRKVVGYKINTQKSIVFLYTSKLPEREKLFQKLPFAIALKRLK